MKYLFLLGRNQMLSEEELKSVLADPSSFRTIGNNFLIYEGALPVPPQAFLDRLGGTIKILETLEEKIPPAKIGDFCFEKLSEAFSGRETKSLFALNAFPPFRVHEFACPPSWGIMNLKKKLKAQDIKARFINKNFQNASHVAVFEEKLIENGLDLTVMPDGKNAIIAKTVAIQNIENYGKRDYGKPFRDARAGMLPPKLAQMMINFATAGKNTKEPVTIFDPFCGTGTVLMESMLMGYSAAGADTDEAMAAGSIQNIEWLKKNFPVDKNVMYSITQKSAVEISPQDFHDFEMTKNLVVVTEPALGPPLSTFPKKEEFEKITKRLETLYLDVFRNLKNWLPKGASIVFLFPCFRIGQHKFAFMSGTIEKVKAIGYSGSVLGLYERPDQIVGRQVAKFRLDP